GHNCAIRCEESDLFTITPPERHALCALLGNSPRANGRNVTRRGTGIERPDVQLGSSGFIRNVGHELVVRGEAWAGELRLAFEDLDRFTFSRFSHGQRKKSTASEVRGVVGQ